jgi:hypothetical protein
MRYMEDGKTSDGKPSEISVDDARRIEGDGFETVHPKLAASPKKTICGRVILRTHFTTIACEMDPGHPPSCEGKGIRR